MEGGFFEVAVGGQCMRRTSRRIFCFMVPVCWCSMLLCSCLHIVPFVLVVALVVSSSLFCLCESEGQGEKY